MENTFDIDLNKLLEKEISIEGIGAEEDVFHTDEITSYYRLMGMIDSIIEQNLQATIALYGFYGYDYFADIYISNNTIEELEKKILTKYIQNEEKSNSQLKYSKKIFGEFLILICGYAQKIEGKIFKGEKIDIDIFKVEDKLAKIIEKMVEKYNTPPLIIGIENILIEDFVSRIINIF